MRRLIHISTLLFFLLPGISAFASPQAVLERMSRTDERESVQLAFTFTTLPDYEVSISGKRVDLLLPDTRLQNELEMIPTDDRIIKVLAEHREKNLKLSLFLRYPPQDIDSSEIKGSRRILLDILLGNPLSKHYPNLASEISGISVMRGKLPDLTNPASIARFNGKWRRFFHEYEADLPISITPRFTLPPFPISQCFTLLRDESGFLPPEAQEAAKREDWQQLAPILRETLREKYGVRLEGESNGEDDEREDSGSPRPQEDESTAGNRRLITLAYADALVRSGDYRQAWRVLGYVDTIYPEIASTEMTSFLRIYLQAVHEDPYLAAMKLGNMETQLSREPRLLPWITLLQAELALATNRPDRAEQILHRDDVAYDDRAAGLRLIHRADTLYQQGKLIKALVVYRKAAREPEFDSRPSSLANFADILYRHGRYQEAASSYRKLTALLTGDDRQNLVLFKLALCELKYRPPKKVLLSLLQIEDGFPGTLGAARSQLKQIDIDLITGKIKEATAAQRYKIPALEAAWREIREEAAFKRILSLHLDGNNREAMDELMVFQRDFRAGDLLIEARALIIEILPGVIRDLITREKYLEALVLAQKNQLFFVRHWVDNHVVGELAEAYVRLGFFDQAEKVYRYLLEIASEEELEELYIKLLATLEDAAKYDLIGDYADRFRHRFPDSVHLDRVFLLHLKALRQSGDLAGAADLLALQERPSNEEIEKTGATILFDLERYDQVLKILTPLDREERLSGRDLYRMAESAFQIKDFDRARPLFERIVNTDLERKDQARYRLAQMNMTENRPDRAVALLKEVAENGTNPLWKKLAREEVELMDLEKGRI